MNRIFKVIAILAVSLGLVIPAYSQVSLGIQTVQQVVSFSATPIFNAATGGIFVMTLTGNVTSSTLVNGTAGETVTFILSQDGTGSRTFVWPTNINGAPGILAAANAVTKVNFTFDGTAWNTSQPVVTTQVAAYTNATTTFSSIPEHNFTIAAGKFLSIVCRLTWQGSANTTGPKYQVTGPASPTAVQVGLNSPITAATAANVSAATTNAFSQAVANTGTITTATNFTDTLSITIQNGANAGVVQLQAAANGAGTLTENAGSQCVASGQ